MMMEENVPESGTIEKAEIPEVSVPDVPIRDYIYALLRYADWIDPAYRKIAQRDQDTDYLNALYLCATDHVPTEKVIEASTKKNATKALQLLRQKTLQEQELGDRWLKLHETSEKAVKLEQQIKGMKQQISELIRSTPDTIYYESEPQQEEFVQLEMEQIIAEQETVAREPATENEEKDVPKFGTSFKEAISKRIDQRKQAHDKKAMVDFLNGLFTQDYSSEQANFILDCIEDGATVDEIKHIASPKLPVPVMERLYRLQHTKGDKTNG